MMSFSISRIPHFNRHMWIAQLAERTAKILVKIEIGHRNIVRARDRHVHDFARSIG